MRSVLGARLLARNVLLSNLVSHSSRTRRLAQRETARQYERFPREPALPEAAPAASFLSQVRTLKPELAANHYIPAPGFIEPRRAEELAAEFFELERAGNYVTDAQAPNSPAAYNFLPFVRLLVEKVPYVSELVGEPVLPTYAYGRIYKTGAVLKRHRDRDACEISFTLNLTRDVAWPIFIEQPNGTAVELDLNPGDAVMYLGCEAYHWRNAYAGNDHAQLFLHYVRAHGPRAWAFFNAARTPPTQSPAARTQPLVSSMPIKESPPPRSANKVGRNEPCPCGSGRKYKHCHGGA